MGKSKANKKVPANVKKVYANMAHCDKCGDEQQMRRTVVVGSGPSRRWSCKKCGDLIPHDRKAPSREVS